jgi:carbamate kinase
MGPKIEAAVAFLEQGGEQVIVTQPHLLEDAIHGRTGTRIVNA